MKRKRDLNSLREAGYRYLGSRARSKHEMSLYLQKKQESWKLPSDSHTVILQELLEQQLLQDAEFGEAWIQSKRVNRQYGPQKLLLQLRQKGLQQSDILEALSQVSEEDWLSSAKKALEKYLAKNKFDSAQERKQKSIQFLLRKGFSFDLSRRVFDATLRTE